MPRASDSSTPAIRRFFVAIVVTQVCESDVSLSLSLSLGWRITKEALLFLSRILSLSPLLVISSLLNPLSRGSLSLSLIQKPDL